MPLTKLARRYHIQKRSNEAAMPPGTISKGSDETVHRGPYALLYESLYFSEKVFGF